MVFCSISLYYSEKLVTGTLFQSFYWWFIGSTIPSLLVIFPFFIVNTAHLFTRNPIPMLLLNTLIVWINDKSDFSLLAYNFKSFIKIRWVTFCLLLAKWYPGAASLKICVSGSRYKTNNNGDKESPWTISHLMLTSPDFPLHLSVLLSMISYFLPKVFKSLHLFLLFPKNLLSASEVPYHRPSYNLSMPLIDFISSF